MAPRPPLRIVELGGIGARPVAPRLWVSRDPQRGLVLWAVRPGREVRRFPMGGAAGGRP